MLETDPPSRAVRAPKSHHGEKRALPSIFRSARLQSGTSPEAADRRLIAGARDRTFSDVMRIAALSMLDCAGGVLDVRKSETAAGQRPPSRQDEVQRQNCAARVQPQVLIL